MPHKTAIGCILINFENVKQIDSSGLGGLIAIQRVVHTANSKVFLCSIHGQVKMLFDLTKMNEIFRVFNSLQEFQEEVVNLQ
ncbi:STAS domain-containing protein [Gloeocapsopsis crepidinum LEGE 06123]|uniref:STAS domain-containing protein n=1 Tax=Gloeocapsopsis crepidinum LEGE 06123 TaxID=588587 RepID=A0ABR9UQ85_9CHRO|nr:STAS domain-containing protein [Gloeocapsopsis crepidinum LEGE 06123]